MVAKSKTIQRNFKLVGLSFQKCSFCTVTTILTFSRYFIIQSSISQNNILRKLDIEDSARFSTKISPGINIDSTQFDYKNQDLNKYGLPSYRDCSPGNMEFCFHSHIWDIIMAWHRSFGSQGSQTPPKPYQGPMLQCSNVPMFQCANIKMFKCSNVPTFQYSNDPMFQFSNVQMFKCSNAKYQM